MIIDAIAVRSTPAKDINAFVDVSIDGVPLKYEMNKSSCILFTLGPGSVGLRVSTICRGP
jgi:hypothetical protein